MTLGLSTASQCLVLDTVAETTVFEPGCLSLNFVSAINGLCVLTQITSLFRSSFISSMMIKMAIPHMVFLRIKCINTRKVLTDKVLHSSLSRWVRCYSSSLVFLDLIKFPIFFQNCSLIL